MTESFDKKRKAVAPVLTVCACVHALAILSDIIYRNVFYREARQKLKDQKRALSEITPPGKYGLIPLLQHGTTSRRAIMLGLLGFLWFKPILAFPLLQFSAYFAQLWFGQKKRAVLFEWDPTRMLRMDLVLVEQLLLVKFLPLSLKWTSFSRSRPRQMVITAFGESKELIVFVLSL
jgi:hypothetical protein